MNSDFDKFFNILSHVLGNLGGSLGGMASVMFGFLLLAGILAGAVMTIWIFRGGLSRSNQHYYSERQTIERYLRDN